MDESTLELIHLGMDGAATPEQARELAEILAGSEQARACAESLRATARAIEGIPMQDPPATLQERVLQELRHRLGAPAKVTPLRRSRWVIGGVWLAAAAGLVAFALRVHGPASPGSGSSTMAAGTMADLDLDRGSWSLVGRESVLTPEGGQAGLTLRRKGDRLLVLADLPSSRDKALSLTWDKDRYILQEASAGSRALQAGPGELVLPAGLTGPVTLLLTPRPGTQGGGRVALSQDGRELLQASTGSH